MNSNKMLRKKSQTEILGLAIVVVLVLLGAFFVLNFLVFKSPSEYRKGFVSSELASSMLNVFLKTNAKECLRIPISELIGDCIQGSSVCCSGCDTSSEIDSCKFVESFANGIFAETLNKWNYKYEFLVYDDINSPKIKIGEKCPLEKKSKLFVIPHRSGTATVKLDICG